MCLSVSSLISVLPRRQGDLYMRKCTAADKPNSDG